MRLPFKMGAVVCEAVKVDFFCMLFFDTYLSDPILIICIAVKGLFITPMLFAQFDEL